MEALFSVNFFRVLKRPSLALLWSGRVLSALDDQLFGVALLWLTTERLGGAAGLIFGPASLLALLFGPFGGAIADRSNRQVLLIGVDIGRGVLIGFLPLLIGIQGLQV
jgi:DHA3 family macrolide efflux protein-like MFS transporter